MLQQWLADQGINGAQIKNAEVTIEDAFIKLLGRRAVG
jgi:hypothetical protein